MVLSEVKRRILSTAKETSLKVKKRKMVCPNPGFYQVRDKEVQSDSVNFKGNFVPDERKLVGTQERVLAISESLQ
jgi:hypothetical protein